MIVLHVVDNAPESSYTRKPHAHSKSSTSSRCTWLMVFHNEAQKLNPQSKTQSVGVLGGWWRSTQNLKTGLNSKIWKCCTCPSWCHSLPRIAKVCTRFEKQKFAVLDACHQDVQLREISLFVFGSHRYTFAKQRARFTFTNASFGCLPALEVSIHKTQTKILWMICHSSRTQWPRSITRQWLDSAPYFSVPKRSARCQHGANRV